MTQRCDWQHCRRRVEAVVVAALLFFDQGKEPETERREEFCSLVSSRDILSQSRKVPDSPIGQRWAQVGRGSGVHSKLCNLQAVATVRRR